MEARARAVCEARARAGETVKRRLLAARDGAIADAAPLFAPGAVRANDNVRANHNGERGGIRDR